MSYRRSTMRPALKRRSPASEIGRNISMENTSMSSFSYQGAGMVRLIVVLTILLFAPLTASATSSPDHSEHAELGGPKGHCAGQCLDNLNHPSHPVEAPLHCHLKSPHPQQGGMSPTPVEGDSPLLTFRGTFVSTMGTATTLQAVLLHAYDSGSPRYILFGNFRS